MSGDLSSLLRLRAAKANLRQNAARATDTIVCQVGDGNGAVMHGSTMWMYVRPVSADLGLMIAANPSGYQWTEGQLVHCEYFHNGPGANALRVTTVPPRNVRQILWIGYSWPENDATLIEGETSTVAALSYTTSYGWDQGSIRVHPTNPNICYLVRYRQSAFGTSGVILKYTDSTGQFDVIGNPGENVEGTFPTAGVSAASQRLGATAIAISDSGEVYFSSGLFGTKIFKIDTGGIVRHLGGTGENLNGATGDDGPAVDARINRVRLMEWNYQNGELWLGDEYNNYWRKITPSGSIHQSCGQPGIGSPPGASGDGGLATAANVGEPAGIISDRLGNIYILSTEPGGGTQKSSIRMINSSGVITKIGGVYTSASQSNGILDHTSSIDGQFFLGEAISVTPDGSSLWLATVSYMYVYRIPLTTSLPTAIIGNGFRVDLTGALSPVSPRVVTGPENITRLSITPGGTLYATVFSQNNNSYNLINPSFIKAVGMP